MYICMYTCMYLCINICMHVCMYVFLNYNKLEYGIFPSYLVFFKYLELFLKMNIRVKKYSDTNIPLWPKHSGMIPLVLATDHSNQILHVRDN